MDEQPSRVTRLGTARALVLLAAVLSVGAAALVCFATLAFGPAVLDRSGLTGAMVLATVVFTLVVLVFSTAASLLAARARTTGSVVVRGCGTLLAGILVGIVALLLLISEAA